MKPYLIESPVDLVTDAKRYAPATGKTFKAVVKEAVETFLKEKGAKKG
ncbi:MAG TPA: hypothetical protein VNN62_13275 [Methylomirabilota bacterium]|jgi:hypothetical protein|nr:hypothetical protein [Methylomirabilota bacterium]